MIFLLCWHSSVRAEVIAKEGVPSGFEDLSAPQDVVVEIFMGGKKMGVAAARVGPETLTFHDPTAVLAALPTVKPLPQIKQALAAPLPLHTEMRCRTMQQADCGVLKPEIFGIIYNDTRNQADLFFHPRFLNLSAPNVAKYLPAADVRGVSALIQTSGAVSGGENSPAYSLRGDGLLSYGRLHLQAVGGQADQGLFLDKVAATKDWQDIQASLGMIPTAAGRILGQQDVLGLTIGRSLASRSDLQLVQGTPLPLFLPRPARVNVLKDGILLSSRFYEAGNIVLDSSDLPYGAYPITLEITDSGGATKRETRFYRKAGTIPPIGTDLWQVGFGMMEEQESGTLPSFGNTPVMQGGYSTRLSDRLGVGSHLLLGKQEGALESSLFWFDNSVQLEVATLATNDHGTGVSFSGYTSAERWSAGFNARRLWLPKATDFFGVSSGTSWDSSLETQVGEGRLGMRSFWQKDDETGTKSLAYGPYYRRPLWRSGLYQVDLDASVTMSDVESVGLLQVRFFTLSPTWNISGDSGMVREHKKAGESRLYGQHQLNAAWNDGEQFPEQDLLLQAGVREEENRRTGNISGNLVNRHGRLQTEMEQPLSGTGTGRYGGSFLFNIAGDRQGISLGGGEIGSSAILAELKGKTNGVYTVVVNGAEKGSLRAGKTLPIPLAPYQLYQVQLRPQSGGMADFDGKPRRVTLYPGNVVRLAWDISPIQVVLGQLVGESGKPLEGIELRAGTTPVRTDSAGYFQLEATQNTIEVQGHCRLQLPKTEEEVVMLGVVRCPK